MVSYLDIADDLCRLFGFRHCYFFPNMERIAQAVANGELVPAPCLPWEWWGARPVDAIVLVTQKDALALLEAGLGAISRWTPEHAADQNLRDWEAALLDPDRLWRAAMDPELWGLIRWATGQPISDRAFKQFQRFVLRYNELKADPGAKARDWREWEKTLWERARSKRPPAVLYQSLAKRLGLREPKDLNPKNSPSLGPLPRECGYCGGTFWPRTVRGVYCSPGCREKVKNMVRRVRYWENPEESRARVRERVRRYRMRRKAAPGVGTNLAPEDSKARATKRNKTRRRNG